MSGREENRVFVGGLAWETDDRNLQDAFSRYGKIVECVVVADRDTGRSRGFGFVTFVDHRAMDDAITDMHGRELDGRVISVNKAKPKSSGEIDIGFSHHGRDYMPSSGGGRRGGGGDRSSGNTDCFKCGRPGHFARECPMGDNGGGGRFSSQFGSGRGGGGGGDRLRIDSYDDRMSRGGRYGDRDRDGRYESLDRYPPSRDGYNGDRYVEPREFQSDYGARERGGYFREVGPRPGGGGSGGPDRFERGSYRERASGPYDRPPRRGENIPASYDRY